MTDHTLSPQAKAWSMTVQQLQAEIDATKRTIIKCKARGWQRGLSAARSYLRGLIIVRNKHLEDHWRAMVIDR